MNGLNSCEESIDDYTSVYSHSKCEWEEMIQHLFNGGFSLQWSLKTLLPNGLKIWQLHLLWSSCVLCVQSWQHIHLTKILQKNPFVIICRRQGLYKITTCKEILILHHCVTDNVQRGMMAYNLID